MKVDRSLSHCRVSPHRSSYRSSVCSDGRRSSTVTKMFVVQNQSSNIEENDQISQQVTKPHCGHGDKSLKLETVGVLASVQ